MKQSIAGSARYHRSVTNRFEPCETVKKAMCASWNTNADQVAQGEIERTFVLDRLTYSDRHGYPSS